MGYALEMDKLLLLVPATAILWRRKDGQIELGSTDDYKSPANWTQPVRSAKPTNKEGWHSEEKHHHRKERWYWVFSLVLSLVIAVGAAFSARYAYKAAAEAHDQALQAGRQADVAEEQLVATTRARLKLVGITDAYVTKGKGVDVAWFNFKPLYRNFGPSPAEDTLFVPHIFVVGGGPATTGDVCEARSGWMTRNGSPSIVYPQEQGGDWIGVQVSLKELKAEAAKVLAVRPNATVYLGVVGCLLYRSGSGRDRYVTGFVGDLHMAGGNQQNDPGKYIPLYDTLMSGPDLIEVGMDVKLLSAWAD